MSQSAAPLIALDTNGTGTVIAYDIPEPTAYSGRNCIDLGIPPDWFFHDTPAATEFPIVSAAVRSPIRSMTSAATGTDDEVLSLIAGAAGVLRIVHNADGSTTFQSNVPMSSKLSQLTPDDVWRLHLADATNQVVLHRSLYGTLTYTVVTPSTQPVRQVAATSSTTKDSGGQQRASQLATSDPTSTPQLRTVIYPSDPNITLPSLPGLITVSGWSSSDTPGDSITSVAIYLDTKKVATLYPGDPRTQPPLDDQGNINTKISISQPGSHVLNAIASSSMGGFDPGILGGVKFTVQVGQVLTVSQPTDGAQITAPSVPMVITVSGSATGGDGGVASVDVLTDNDQTTKTQAQPSVGSDWSTWRASVRIVNVGQHTLTVSCYDNGGNKIAIALQVFISVKPRLTELGQRLLLVETYRLSSFLGRFGAGRVVKTFSLLPGETSNISVRTYKKITTQSKDASSILDSFSDESATDFENAVAEEQHNEQANKESYNYSVQGQASASWGWGSASISAGVNGGTNSSRDTFAKNASNALQKHSSKASNKRDVNVTTEYTATSDTEGEEKIERTVKNINVSRTLNFVFRQMNQEFFSILHLVDARVAHYREDLDTSNTEAPTTVTTYREATIAELDSFLETVIIDGGRTSRVTGGLTYRAFIENKILELLCYVPNYQGNTQSLIELCVPQVSGQGIVPPPAELSYRRVDPNLVSTYTTPNDDTLKVPGIIVDVTQTVIRTEGIMVDALLGQGEALDDYSQGLQTAAVAERNLANDKQQAENDKAQLAIAIIKAKDSDEAKLFAQVYPPPEEAPEVALTAATDGNVPARSAP